MINTLYSADALGTPLAFLLSLVIGAGFGFALERAGFSSSRRLAGIFYLTDMTVLKVMFTALITALLGLSYLAALGWIRMDQIFLMPTIYGAQIAGGLLLGAGFVMGSWCPGTAVAGLAAGRMDALVFLTGAIGGSVLFNELFPFLGGLYTAGDHGVQFVHDSVGLPRNLFVFLFTLAAVGAFWFAEWVERARTGKASYLGTPFLKAFSAALVAVAAGLLVLQPDAPPESATAVPAPGPGVVNENNLLASVEAANDHMEPEELADRLMAGDNTIVVVDVRPPNEFRHFHIRGARNVALPDLAEALEPHRNQGTIVLYSNGMTHPAQARDSLLRQGYRNVLILTDGLHGFRDRCLKPVSLRAEPLPPVTAARINDWRAFFESRPLPPATTAEPAAQAAGPRAVTTDWLATRTTRPGLLILDLRSQPEYNTSHIPNSFSLNIESLRGNLGGVPSMLLPAAMLAAQFSQLGLLPEIEVVLVPGDKLHDSTLAGLALERLGHRTYAVLDGGFARWASENRLVDTALPEATASRYPTPPREDGFTVDRHYVQASLGKPGTVIIDVRPADYFTGVKSDEARAGHIPGALNRPYTQDLATGPEGKPASFFKPVSELAEEYAKLIPAKDTEVIVHCRTGHQASQTWFVLKHLLGYPHVRWYDAGWTEWSARPELPVVK